MKAIKKEVLSLVKNIDKEIMYIAAVMTLAILYFLNPLENVNLMEWDRTFSSASIWGISIDKRISNFYMIFFFAVPGVFAVLTMAYTVVIKLRESYKNMYVKISTILLFSIIASYIYRYGVGSTIVSANALLQTAIVFQVVLTIIAICDSKHQLKFSDITVIYVTYMLAIISINIMLGMEIIECIIIVSVIIVAYMVFCQVSPIGGKVLGSTRNLLFLLMWIPALMRGVLEVLYFLNEKGYRITEYWTIMLVTIGIFCVLAAMISMFFNKRGKDFSIIGYVGAVTSLGALYFISYAYQYVWSYMNYANVYEAANQTVAADTIIKGKLPIIDYFSAHALGDVWTRVIYCILHGDINGIFVDPYGGIAAICGFLCLFFIVSSIFNQEIGVLFVFLFPCLISTTKITTICFISVAMLVFIIKKPNIRSYVLFWICVLISAFITYDEGISLGIGCIVAYLIVLLLQTKWKELKTFIAGGILVGGATLALYFIYCWRTDISAIMRLREWLSVGLGSSTSWATLSFGETSSVAFLVSYFVAPMCAVTVLVLTIIKYWRSKKYPLLAAVTVAFSLTEILYISRGIIYHNLAVCSGKTGVLLNVVHWTLSLYVLYSYAIKEVSEKKKLFAWIGTFGIVLIIEGVVVTGGLPSQYSALYGGALQTSESWNLQNEKTDILGKERIIFDENTIAFVNQFDKIFDVLLEEDETFLDFANITSLYVLTGRERPFYVAQSPSLLTDLYSQECYLEEISDYNIPLVIMGTTETAFTQQMVGVPHNIRYYMIAEYIYENYRPLVAMEEFVIWCKSEQHEMFSEMLQCEGMVNEGYTLVDYGYDATVITQDENGNMQYLYKPYHSYGLGEIPYIWANMDEYKAIENDEILKADMQEQNVYVFEGSQNIDVLGGNYVAFNCINYGTGDSTALITFQDSTNQGARYEYSFSAMPGEHTYMLRVSQDYFWHAFNIDTIIYTYADGVMVNNVRILEGD